MRPNGRCSGFWRKTPNTRAACIVTLSKPTVSTARANGAASNSTRIITGSSPKREKNEFPMRRLNLILLAVATVFLVWMLSEIGWAEVGRQVLLIGYAWPLLLAPFGLVTYLWAVSWNCLLLTEESRP